MEIEYDDEYFDDELKYKLVILDVNRRARRGETLESIVRDYKPRCGASIADLENLLDMPTDAVEYTLKLQPGDKIWTLDREEYGQLDEALYLWIAHTRFKGRPVYFDDLYLKVLKYRHMFPVGNFSIGSFCDWLNYFKTRYGVEFDARPDKSNQEADKFAEDKSGRAPEI